MKDMNVGFVKVLTDYYDSLLDKWVKKLIFELDSEDGLEYYVCITSTDNKIWQPDEDNVRFSDHKFEGELEFDLDYALSTGNDEDAESILIILNSLDEIRKNIYYLLPQLLEMTKDNDDYSYNENN